MNCAGQMPYFARNAAARYAVVSTSPLCGKKYFRSSGKVSDACFGREAHDGVEVLEHVARRDDAGSG